MSIRYRCVTCHAALETDQVVYRCPKCAAKPPKAGAAQGYPTGYLSVEFTPGASLLRGSPVNPLDFLPLPVPGVGAFPAGGSPLVQPLSLRKKYGFPRLFLKNDTLNPSGSLKDRASQLVAAQAMDRKERRVALASTGNAGASMACAGAALGLEVILFVPAAAPRAKLLQSLMYGARVVPVEGTYDDAFSLSIAYTTAYSGINRNTGYNPFTVEGKKTVAIEVFNQLGSRPPDVMYVPTGDGVIFSGTCKGFTDLRTAGSAQRVPVMVVVQAEGSNAIARSWREGKQVVLERTSTIADSLSVCRPASGAMALDFLAKTDGRAVEANDHQISEAQAELAKEAGLFVEPSSAAAWAGFLNDRKTLDPEATIVVLLTGTGFKDTAAAEKLVSLPAPCSADLEGATRLLSDVYGVRHARGVNGG
ncbi:MAG: pyridoxal-phosphate dependent enzyme [Spirochaetia bacterium]|jgi:threonine synthase